MTQDVTEAEAQLISAWLDGEAPDDTRADIEKRLEADIAFAEVSADYSKIDADVRHAARIAVAGIPSLKTYATIRDGFARRRRRARWRGGLRSALPIAASIVILIGGALVLEDRMVHRLAAAQSESTRLVSAAMQQALEAARSGESIAIGDGNSRAIVNGTVTPVRTYRSKTNHWCREFKEQLTIGGETVARTGVACRTADGAWRRIETKVKGQAPLTFAPRPKI